MTKKELKKILDRNVKSKPDDWRYGQWVFNFVRFHYREAAESLRCSKVDCFYDNSKADAFIEAAAKIITKLNNKNGTITTD